MSDDWPAVWRPREDWGRPTYDEGGVLPQGLTVAYNDTGKPIPVFTAEQWHFHPNVVLHADCVKCSWLRSRPIPDPTCPDSPAKPDA